MIDATSYDHKQRRKRVRTTTYKNISISIEALEWIDKLITVNKKRRSKPDNRSSMISFLILQHKMKTIQKAKTNSS